MGSASRCGPKSARRLALVAALVGCGAVASADDEPGPDDPVPWGKPRLAPIVYSAWPFDAEEAKRRRRETAERLLVTEEKILDLGGGVTMTLVLIPAGEFVMGSPEGEVDRREDEGPQRRVRITKPFYIGKYELTQAQYERITGRRLSAFPGASKPVDRMPFTEAYSFCRSLSERTGLVARLPSEAEWEYACRAGSGARFCFGDDEARLGEHAWYAGNSDGATHDVGLKRPNAWGLHDMHGNVREWCYDNYDHFSYAKALNEDPAGPKGRRRDHVFRGGCWTTLPFGCRSAGRACRSSVRGRPPLFGMRVVVMPRHLQ
jgi:formylglycine-generating enzyme required for sulfatase activity